VLKNYIYKFFNFKLFFSKNKFFFVLNKEIPQDLVNSINLNFKDENEEIKDITDTSKFGIVKSKTGSIPITDILDFSSIDSKRSVKKLYI